jgi:hypothetical protein
MQFFANFHPTIRLEQDHVSSNRDPALRYWWSMIFSENRRPPPIKPGASFFAIMLQSHAFDALQH